MYKIIFYKAVVLLAEQEENSKPVDEGQSRLSSIYSSLLSLQAIWNTVWMCNFLSFGSYCNMTYYMAKYTFDTVPSCTQKQYSAFLEILNWVLHWASAEDSILLLRDFDTHTGNLWETFWGAWLAAMTLLIWTLLMTCYWTIGPIMDCP